MNYRRDISLELEERLQEQRSYIQIVLGPRQTGKTTAVKQALAGCDIPAHVSAADSVEKLGSEWLEVEWMQARALAARGPAVLFIDEIQKIHGWSETVKRLWDEDTWDDLDLRVVLSGSSSLLLSAGVNESLMGRYEMIRSTHWGLSEMNAAFGYSMEDYLTFGGYPGAARLRKNPKRWRDYLRDSIIEATISKDILQMERVRKPALMRALFELGAQCSGQEISYRKILGQLDDKGNTETVRNYLDLLSNAGMMSGLQKFDPKQIKSKASSPRLMLHDSSLMVSSWKNLSDLTKDPSQRGHLVETAVGASLLAWGQKEGFDLYWWRDGAAEVDFVAQRGADVIAIEVKSGRVKPTGIVDFCKRNPSAQPLVVGSRNLSVERFLFHEDPLFD